MIAESTNHIICITSRLLIHFIINAVSINLVAKSPLRENVRENSRVAAKLTAKLSLKNIKKIKSNKLTQFK